MYKYCPMCSKELINKEIENEGLIPYCTSCNKLYFPFSYPCVICIVKYQNKYLLIKQNYVSNNYILVAGHIKKGSDAEITIKEEIKEEVGLEITSFQYIKSYYHERGGNIMFGYYVETKGNITINNNEVDSYILVEEQEAIQLLEDAKIASRLLQDYIKIRNNAKGY